MARDRKIGQKAKDRFKKSMDSFVRGLSRDIIVYLPGTEAECPNCYYDKVNRKSSGIPKVVTSDPNYFITGRCPVCYDKGVLITERRRCIDGVVIWDPSSDSMNSLTFTEAGYEGATKVRIKTDVCHLDIIKTCRNVVIDGISCKLSNPPIIRGIGSKALLIADFFTSDKPLTNSGEFV